MPLLSQSTGYIDGKVINNSTLSPVPFAAIKLKNRELGVFANAEGDFKIIRNPEFKTDSLIITCIGFKRLSVSYPDLKENEVNMIYLTPAIYGLREVTITASRKKLSPSIIVARAIRNIKNNYPQNPFSYISYYRDYQKKGGEYFNLNEAIVQTLDEGFQKLEMFNQYRLLDFRENMNFSRMDVSPYYDNSILTGLNRSQAPDNSNSYKSIPLAELGDQYGNELFILLVHDAIRNYRKNSFSFINTFPDDFIRNHSFSDPVAVYNNNLLLYKIEFKARKWLINDSIMVDGAIYIQPKDYSIHKLEYSCYYITNGEKDKEMFNIDIEYGYENAVENLMCLKYISFNNIFNVLDTSDSSYFKVLDSYWNTSEYSNSTIILEFNERVGPESARRKDNYEVIMGKKLLKIKSIQAAGRRVLLKFKSEDVKRHNDGCWIGVRNIKDIHGNIIDKRKSIELYQYRELFVQEYNKPLILPDSCYMQYMPLEKNCITKFSGKEKYWMNTPENIKVEK